MRIETGMRPEESIISLRDAAVNDALTRLSKDGFSPHAELRVKAGIEARFLPYVEEARVVSEQLQLPEMTEFKKKFSEFIDARIAVIACSDGRIDLQVIGDPGISVFHRIPGGVAGSRDSTSSDLMIPRNPNIIASIVTDFEERAEDGRNLKLFEFAGGHFDSTDPLHKGCGAIKRALQNNNQLPLVKMRHGGVGKYFELTGEGFFAFENIAKGKNGEAETPDVFYDTWSRGLVFGLRTAHKNFDPQKNLRKNLEDMHERGEVLMTELLDPLFTDKITALKEITLEQMEESAISEQYIEALRRVAQRGYIDLDNPTDLAVNTILISKIAQTITLGHEAQDEFGSFIPDHFLENKSAEFARTLAYTAIRNVVARHLGKIRPGTHGLLNHNEELIVVGPTAPEFNKKAVGFRVATASGPITPQDMDLTSALHDILRERFNEEGVNPEEEALVMLVVETYDPGDYSTKKIARREYNRIFSTVGHNAAELRNKRKEDVRDGYLVVIGAIIDPDTKIIKEIVR